MEIQKHLDYVVNLQVINNKVVTTSKIIAEEFGKEHFTVMRDIREILDSGIGLYNFVLSSYTNSQNKQQPMYILDRKACTILISRFTGIESLRFMDKYVDAFDAMESELMKRNTISTPSNMLEAMEFATNQLRISIEQQKVIDEQSKQLVIAQPKTEFYDKVIDMNGWYSWSQVAKIINIKNTGRNNLLNKLCVLGILNIKNEPYQKYVDRGYFKCIHHIESKTNKITTITSLKGIEFICKKLEIIADLNNLPTFVNETKLKSLF